MQRLGRLSEAQGEERVSVEQELAVVAQQMQALQPRGYEYRGNVWVFLRR